MGSAVAEEGIGEKKKRMTKHKEEPMMAVKLPQKCDRSNRVSV